MCPRAPPASRAPTGVSFADGLRPPLTLEPLRANGQALRGRQGKPAPSCAGPPIPGPTAGHPAGAGHLRIAEQCWARREPYPTYLPQPSTDTSALCSVNWLWSRALGPSLRQELRCGAGPERRLDANTARRPARIFNRGGASNAFTTSNTTTARCVWPGSGSHLSLHSRRS